MKIDLRPLLKGDTDVISIDYTLKPDFEADVSFPSDVRVQGSVKAMAGYIRLSLTATLPFESICARCLTPVQDRVELVFERTVVAPGTVSEETLEERFDEYAVLEGNVLDVDEALREELVLELPMRVLCSPDCPGLCPKCGKPLKNGDCGCVQKETDPRWDVLRQLLQKEDNAES
ncbi:MAG: DUF177 domain-containing protein, partial [Clostridia bacterium]|nr:DUF177 domain-containing protein [Clostridia bacterium]